MTYKILCLLLGAATASAWWAFACFPELRDFQRAPFIIPTVMLTIASLAVILKETLNILAK